MIVAAVAGFIVAEPAASRDYETVERVGDDSEAYAVDLSSETRLRFVLESDEAEAPGTDGPSARFSVYDPADEHFASFALAGDGDDATVLADRPGAWVVFVSEAQDAQLAVQVADDDGDGSQVRNLDVKERRWSVADGDGGPLDQELALRLDRRPAQAYLDVDGVVDSLDARASSEEGPVHRYADVDSTADGNLVNGSQEVTPENLAEGTYEIDAQADRLNGSIAFVAQSYERAEAATVQDTGGTSDDGAADSNTSTEPAPGSEVASLAEGEAARVAPQGAQEIAFDVPDDAKATIYVYNASDDLVEQVEVGHDDGREDGAGNGSARTATYALPTKANHAVYVADLDSHGWGGGDEDDENRSQVTVRLPDVEDAQPASKLSVAEEEVTVEGDNGTASVDLPGGLAAVGAESDGWTWGSDDVTVEGPRGVVLESRSGGSDGGYWFGSGYETYPDRFSDGTFTVSVEDEGFGFGEDETHVRFAFLDH